jgi:hypothetical protein
VRIFIGFDTRETGLGALAAPPARRIRVSITPLMLSQLTGNFRRERHPLQSTEFAFAISHASLSGFSGWSLFMDCDMLLREDIARLWALRDDCYAVQVVKHLHRPRESTKFLGQKQTAYQKKNWSSVMLFNNAKCTTLSEEYVNQASGLELHQFHWLGDERLIGALPHRWNHLVGYDDPDPDAALLHYTLGGPWFRDHADGPLSNEWRSEREHMLVAIER